MHAKRSATLFFPGTCIFLCRYELERRTGKLKEIGSSVRDEKTADQKNILMIHCKTAKNCQQSYVFRTVCFKIKTCSKVSNFKCFMFDQHIHVVHQCKFWPTFCHGWCGTCCQFPCTSYQQPTKRKCVSQAHQYRVKICWLRMWCRNPT